MKFKLILIQMLMFLMAVNTFADVKITLLDIEEYKLTEEKRLYKISAKSKNISYKKIKKFRFFNKERFISNSSYYLDGKFESSGLHMTFEKAYFLEGKFIMLNTQGVYKTNPFEAQKAVYTRKDLSFKNILITIGKRKYKKIKYKIVF